MPGKTAMPQPKFAHLLLRVWLRRIGKAGVGSCVAYVLWKLYRSRMTRCLPSTAAAQGQADILCEVQSEEAVLLRQENLPRKSPVGESDGGSPSTQAHLQSDDALKHQIDFEPAGPTAKEHDARPDCRADHERVGQQEQADILREVRSEEAVALRQEDLPTKSPVCGSDGGSPSAQAHLQSDDALKQQIDVEPAGPTAKEHDARPDCRADLEKVAQQEQADILCEVRSEEAVALRQEDLTTKSPVCGSDGGSPSAQAHLQSDDALKQQIDFEPAGPTAEEHDTRPDCRADLEKVAQQEQADILREVRSEEAVALRQEDLTKMSPVGGSDVGSPSTGAHLQTDDALKLEIESQADGTPAPEHDARPDCRADAGKVGEQDPVNSNQTPRTAAVSVTGKQGGRRRQGNKRANKR